MQKRWGAFALAMAIMLTACGRPSPRVKPAAAPQVTTIRMALWSNAAPIFAPVIAAFQEKHPEYRVETVPIPAWTQIEGMVRGGTVDLVPNTLTWDHMIRNGMRPVSIDPYVAKSRFDTAPFGPILEGEVVGGSHYGLPLYGYPFVFAYNKRLVAEAGVTIPTDSWTWEEFRDTATRLTRGKGDTKIWGFDWSPSTAPENLVYLMALQRAPAGGLPDSQTSAGRVPAAGRGRPGSGLLDRSQPAGVGRIPRCQARRVGTGAPGALVRAA